MNDPATKLKTIVEAFQMSCVAISIASGRGISKSEVHRILNEAKPPSPAAKQAITRGVMACLMQKMDSAWLFDE